MLAQMRSEHKAIGFKIGREGREGGKEGEGVGRNFKIGREARSVRGEIKRLEGRRGEQERKRERGGSKWIKK